jgi:hypothetical protein
MRRLFLAVSFAFWAAMMVLVFQRHTAARRANDDSSFLALVRGAPSSPARYLLRSGERALGRATVFADADVVGDAVAYRLILRARMALPEEVFVDGEAVVRDPGGLSGFSLTLRAGSSVVRLRGTVSKEELCIERAGATPGSVRIGLPNAWETGLTVREAGKAVVKTSGTFVSARRYIVGTGAGEAELWVDGRGVLLRMEVPSWRFSAVREETGGGDG